MTIIALTIAGSDSGGGAGIQADLKAFSANRTYGASVITAVTAQNTFGVQAIESLSPAIVRDQIRSIFDDLPVAAVKIGMVGSAEMIATVAEQLRAILLHRSDLPIVLDPVMIAKSGDRLLAEDAMQAMREALIPLATILTPNAPEAAALLGEEQAEEEADRTAQARALMALGVPWVLMKGGHISGDICTDILAGPQWHRFTSPRQQTQNTHGTGCTLAAALTAHLALGKSVPEATASAHHYLQGAINAGKNLNIGAGQGPVHHFYQWWKA